MINQGKKKTETEFTPNKMKITEKSENDFKVCL